MATTLNRLGTKKPGRSGEAVEFYDTSTANAVLTVTTPTDRERLRRLAGVYVKFSTSVTKNVTVTFDSTLGAAFDNLLQTIALTAAASGSWVPAGDIWLGPGDAIVAESEAGGAGVTATIRVQLEEW